MPASMPCLNSGRQVCSTPTLPALTASLRTPCLIPCFHCSLSVPPAFLSSWISTPSHAATPPSFRHHLLQEGSRRRAGQRQDTMAPTAGLLQQAAVPAGAWVLTLLYIPSGL